MLYHAFINEYVEMEQCPLSKNRFNAKKDALITIGDLHANPIKFIYFLTRHRVFSSMDATTYNKLIAFCKFAPQTVFSYHAYYALLEKLFINSEAKILLIGDEVSDRGPNDLLTLPIYKVLYEGKAQVTTLFSNHGLEFVRAYESQEHFSSSWIDSSYTQSMNALEKSIQSEVVTRKEVSMLIQYYKSTLKLLSYTVYEKENEITIFSHAPIDINIIAYIANKLNIPFQDDTPIQLAQSIDNINNIFMGYVQNNTVHTLFDHEALENGADEIEPEIYPLEFLLWNRNYDVIYRDQTFKGYKINYVHGHDATSQDEENTCSLDNTLGKDFNDNQGDYTVLYSRDSTFITKNEPNQALRV